jgi:hypothetical protein
MVLTELILVEETKKGNMQSGGGIQNNIPRKNAAPIRGQIWPKGTAGHPTLNGWEGTSYESPFTASAIPPLLNHYNTATLPQVHAMQIATPGTVVPIHAFTRINPSETTVLHTSGKPEPANKRVGGPSPTSNTPFHPGVPPPAPVHARRPTAKMANIHHNNLLRAPSFNHPGNTTSGTLSGHAHSDSNVARWSTVKRGAAG